MYENKNCNTIHLWYDLNRLRSIGISTIEIFHPMHCKHIVSGYEIKWTKPQSVEVYRTSGVKVHNELDGAYVVLDKSKEKDYACTPLSDKVSID